MAPDVDSGRIEYHLEQLLAALRTQQDFLQSENTRLQDQLDIERRGHKSMRDEYREKFEEWSREKKAFEGHISALQDTNRRVVCLIDGDGTIFSQEYIARGQAGGLEAAQRLAEEIQDYLRRQESAPPSTYELSIYCFLHKKGLMDTLGKTGYYEQRAQFDDFLAGFNQAHQRYLMVDVGAGKENADSKLRTFLADNVRMPSTWKIFLGVTHDNGYVPDLRTIMLNGNKEKLILLPGYSEIATGIQKLGFPSLNIPGLFMLDKLNVFQAQRRQSFGKGGLQASSPAFVPAKLAGGRRNSRANGVPASDHTAKSPPRSASPCSHSSQSKSGSSEDSSGASSGEESPLRGATPLPSYSPGMLQTPPLNVPLTKLRPAPCNSFYLKNVCLNPRCVYAHDWILNDTQIQVLRKLTKNALCLAVKDGKPATCPYGGPENCIYSHKCPKGPNCYYLSKGKCKFKQPGMHDP
ncbi:hypothetical protein K474DRAFT_1707982 [Panus rudis PR-1116 ss-1]|nr:hypothetical protein K474DRAFT_1707982 [Panus rudis PR-1116 ss-1]